jgi:hypothetical protein
VDVVTTRQVWEKPSFLFRLCLVVADMCGEIQATAMILRGRGRVCQEKWWGKKFGNENGPL